jgi:hypothetical protein
MKRALAERAKQSLTSPSQDSSVPPAKLRRVATAPVSSSTQALVESFVSEPPLISSSTAQETASDAAGIPTISSATTPATTTSVKPLPAATHSKKRPELSVPDDANAFYLKSQNKALAVEWRDLNHQVLALQAERSDRRKHTLEAVHALYSLQASWSQLEDMIAKSSGASHHGNGGNDHAQHQPQQVYSQANDSIPQVASNLLIAASPLSASTGTGDSMEWTVALAQALAQLGAPPMLPVLTSNGIEKCTSIESPSWNGSEWSQQCASNIAFRAALLQDRLKSILFRPVQEATVSSSEAWLQENQRIHELQSQVASLQSQLTESVASRSEAVANERKLRRNFYKLQAGLLSKEQFLNEMNLDPDDDLGSWDQDRQQELLVEQARRNQSEGGPNSTSTQQDEMMDSQRGENGGSATSGQVQALLGQIHDLEQKVATREKSIQNVSKATCAITECCRLFVVLTRYIFDVLAALTAGD